jgi:hypothetical protein
MGGVCVHVWFGSLSENMVHWQSPPPPNNRQLVAVLTPPPSDWAKKEYICNYVEMLSLMSFLA